MDHSIAAIASDLNIPITVLASNDDPVMTPEVIEQRVMKVLVAADLKTTQEVGHLIPLEDPGWIAAQIRNAMKEEQAK